MLPPQPRARVGSPRGAVLRAPWRGLRFTLRVLAAGSICLLLTACASPLRILSSAARPLKTEPQRLSQSGNVGSHAGQVSTELRLLSFNAGLAPGVVPRVEERAKELASALPQEGFDVACLQEVWLERHQTALRQAFTKHAELQSAGQDHGAPDRPAPRAKLSWLSFAAEPQAELSCADRELSSLLGCFAKQCLGATNTGKPSAAECALSRCRAQVDALSPDCVACVGRDPSDPIASLAGCAGSGTAPASVAALAGVPVGSHERGGAAGKRESSGPHPRPYLLGGEYGLALVSRLPVVASRLERVDSSMHPRGIIHARVFHPSFGEVDTYCTHLTPILNGVTPPPLGFVAEQSKQLGRLLELSKPNGRPVVVLGDLNFGPAGVGYQARVPQHYKRLLAAGFVDWAPKDTACSFCYDNGLRSHAEAGGMRIDHIVTQGLPSGVSVEYQPRLVSPPLSDHYGVELLLRKR